jgi:hypothetical protein
MSVDAMIRPEAYLGKCIFLGNRASEVNDRNSALSP